MGDELVGWMIAGFHDDIARLLTIGVPLVTELLNDVVTVQITDPTARPDWFEVLFPG
jgi:hypothetical protein